jgi:exosome complex component RRP40
MEPIIVLPGDNITKNIHGGSDDVDDATVDENYEQRAIKLGTGIRYDDETTNFFATNAGRLVIIQHKHKNQKIVYVEQNIRKRYRPVVDDRIIGIVEDHAGSDGLGGDMYRVNIQSSHPAWISNLSFEGATKRNKPSLQPGQVIYARIMPSIAAAEVMSTSSSTTTAKNNNSKYHVSSQLVFDPITLSCTNGPLDGPIARKDWMTSEGAYGELRGGTVCTVPILLARKLLHPNCVVINELASYSQTIQFELAVGVNGFVWIHSTRAEYTIMIQNAIQNSAVMTSEQIRSMVKSIVYTVEKRLQQERDAMAD